MAKGLAPKLLCAIVTLPGKAKQKEFVPSTTKKY